MQLAERVNGRGDHAEAGSPLPQRTGSGVRLDDTRELLLLVGQRCNPLLKSIGAKRVLRGERVKQQDADQAGDEERPNDE
jgi:hypothetical protein